VAQGKQAGKAKPGRDAASAGSILNPTFILSLIYAAIFIIAPLFLGTVAGSARIDYLSFIILPLLASFLIFRNLTIVRGASAAVLGLWLVYYILGGIFGEYPFLSTVEFLKFSCWVSVFALTLIALEYIKASVLVRIAALAGVLPSLWGFFLFIGHDPSSGEYIGLSGTFGLHNPFAGFLLLTIPLAAYCVWESRSRQWERLVWPVVLIIEVAAFILTKSRAGWIVAFIVLLAFGFMSLSKTRFASFPRIAGWIVSVFVVISISAFVLKPAGLVEHFGSIFNSLDYSVQGRLTYWEGGLAIFRDNPVFGTGPGTFANAYTRYQPDFIYYSTDPHSYVIRVLSGQGIVGAVFLATLLILFAGLFSRWRANDSTGLATVCALSAAGCALHSGLDFDLTYAPNAWILMAILALAAHFGRASEEAFPALPARVYPSLRIFSANVIVAGSLVFAWGVGVLYANAPFLSFEARAGSDSVSKAALDAPFKYSPLLSRRFEEIMYSQTDQASRSALLSELATRVKLFNEASPKVASAHYLAALIAGIIPSSGIDLEKELRAAVELDPSNYLEYHASLAKYLDDAGREKEAYGVLKECLTVYIHVDEPIHPRHYRPDWQSRNPLLLMMWRKLSHYEQVFGDPEIAADYAEIAQRIEEYIAARE